MLQDPINYYKFQKNLRRAEHEKRFLELRGLWPAAKNGGVNEMV